MDEMNGGFTTEQKKYLERFATKEDLKEGLKACATKTVADSLCIAVVQLQEDVREIQATMATKKDIDRVLAAIGALGRRLDRRLVLLEARA